MSDPEVDYETWCEVRRHTPLTSEDFMNAVTMLDDLHELLAHDIGPGLTLGAMQAMGDDFAPETHAWLLEFTRVLADQLEAMSDKAEVIEQRQQQQGDKR